MIQNVFSEKNLLSKNDVFADIINGFLFNGESVIKPDELEEQVMISSTYIETAYYTNIGRVVTKRWKNVIIRVVSIGGNITEPDADMPLKLIDFDGTEYCRQLNAVKTDMYPVITLVLYFGLKRWDKPLSLLETLNVSEHLMPFVNDYKVNLFEVAFLDKEKVEMFKSDFKFVVDYFVQIQNTGKYIVDTVRLTYSQETLDFLSELIDYDEAEAVGRTVGRAEGKRLSQIEIAHNLYTMGWALNDISKVLNVELEQLKEWLGVQPS